MPVKPQNSPPSRSDTEEPEYNDMEMVGKQLNEIIDELNQDIEAGSREYVRSRSASELNNEERYYLMATERGDAATVKRYLENPKKYHINPNCMDPLGRNSMHIAIENEHIELLEVLLSYPNLELGDSLLLAINEEHLEAVELLLQAQSERSHRKNLSGLLGAPPSSSFTADITPIILAAHRDNYEIIKLLLDRDDSIPKPHDMRCPCSECLRASKEDSLRHSKSRINAYRALASPSLIALSSKDPILTAFELSWELQRLGHLENEFKSEYEELAKQCQKFSTALLEQTRGSEELAIVLNHDIGQMNVQHIQKIGVANESPDTPHHEVMSLSRLKLAIKYEQKQFVAHAHCQQLLASLWYDGLPGFRRKSFISQVNMVGVICSMFPVLSFIYLIAPKSKVGSIIRKPFIKFLCHSASYLIFLGLLILAAVRIEFVFNDLMDDRMDDRGPIPSAVEWVIVVYIIGFIWSEIKQLWDIGIKAYVTDSWNLLDFATNAFYIATITLRAVAYFRSLNNPSYANVRRGDWDSYDPILISECLFATANICSTLKLVYIFTIHPSLGPLQISLGRMLNDIIKWFTMYLLVLIAFAFGLNQLYWFYAHQRSVTCDSSPFSYTGTEGDKYNYCSTRGRYFTNLFEIAQSLYWSFYGLIDLTNFNLEYPHIVTEFVGKLMFGAYSCIAFIVLINMLIAMMNNSYEIIVQQADTEWKFSRSKLWISYFEEGGTLPVPFNIIPSPKTIYYFFLWFKNKLFTCAKNHRKSQWKSIRNIVKKVNEKEARYQAVMQDLIRRYLMHRQKAEDDKGVTEDDLNEIKGDISAFRYELLEILKTNGMKTPSYAQKSSKLRRKGSKRGFSRMSKKVNIETIPEENGGVPGDDSTEVSGNGNIKGNMKRGQLKSDGGTFSSGSLNSFASSRSESQSSCEEYDSGITPNGTSIESLATAVDMRLHTETNERKRINDGNKKSLSTPELMLNPRQLAQKSAPVVKPADMPFNSSTGLIKKESDDRSDEEVPAPNTYFYSGNMNTSAPTVSPPDNTPEEDANEDTSSSNQQRSDLV